MKPFLILQLRPETEAADNEYEAFLSKGGLTPADTHRIRLDQEVLPPDLDLSVYAGTIVGGGPGCVSDPDAAKPPVEKRIEDAVMSLMPEITARDLPFLGCCYGIGILAHHLGGAVSKARYGEPVGTSTCHLTDAGRSDPLLAGCPDSFDAFVGHKEAAQNLPPGATHLLRSDACPFQMIRHGSHVYATQFHPEADPQVFHLRIDIYKHRGYFPPETADALHAMVDAADVHAPERILKNFVARYG
ncbi:glutamine amidotransferase [Psychromarinibacter sp. C21-152]|uniref:Glutamine amidotransferase n=1 Tax=Psychromarinibacter sediminicola TaxID=3033385 RepID=A0AAE3NS12_9RHOB|nr:glutamine amidotransferase [Psychromarinibacter sediminicola]MDF0601017.1 glutamine amidotransferase [Psychromarinibacter sediminicola]